MGRIGEAQDPWVGIPAAFFACWHSMHKLRQEFQIGWLKVSMGKRHVLLYVIHTVKYGGMESILSRRLRYFDRNPGLVSWLVMSFARWRSGLCWSICTARGVAPSFLLPNGVYIAKELLFHRFSGVVSWWLSIWILMKVVGAGFLKMS